MANILVINAGSSSLKYQLIDMAVPTVLAKGIVERIGIENPIIKHKPTGKNPAEIKLTITDHKGAIAAVIDALTDQTHGVIPDLKSIVALGHRVVHGGEKFSGSVLITPDVIEALEENIELAPLHNPANLMGIEACMELMPGIPNVGVFDTAFHADMPIEAFLYGLPYNMYSEYRIRRYGFHGTSHKYVSQRVAKAMGKNVTDLRIITCHLGNGSSVAAVDRGRSVDTSMGFTPLEGLVMGTRSGDLDPAIIPYIMNKLNMSVDETIAYMNKESGVYGISGVSSDFRDLHEAREKGDKRAEIALNVFCYRVKKYIGAYAAVMGGVDAVAFAGGVGENDDYVREFSCKGLEFMGIEIDKSANDGHRSTQKLISKPGSKVQVMVMPTDEELMIATDTYEICCKK